MKITKEDFESWRDNIVTEEVFRAFDRLGERAKQTWLAASWGKGRCDPVLLADLSKYLDQGSRSAGECSRNYVVFDDKLIDIIRKYGLAGTAGPLAALGLPNQEAQAAP